MADCLTLKKSNCKNCYKCIRHCPVKSIRFSGNQAYIIGNECILCGQCFVVCPQNAKEIVDETEKVQRAAAVRRAGLSPASRLPLSPTTTAWASRACAKPSKRWALPTRRRPRSAQPSSRREYERMLDGGTARRAHFLLLP